MSLRSVALLSVMAFVFVSGAWAACWEGTYLLGDTQYGDCKNYYTGEGGAWDAGSFTAECESRYQLCPSVVQHGAGYYVIQDYTESRCRSTLTGCGYRELKTAYSCYYTTYCENPVEADSVSCKPPKVWNSANGTCDSLVEPDTTYRCVNTTMASGTYGERPIAHIYRCVTTGSSSDVCERTSTLNGTCQDWDFCEDDQSDCDIPKDTTDKTPCSRSGSGTTSTGRCYYACPDGSTVSCKPTSTEYVAGAVWVGICPERPPEDCLPPSGPSSSSDNSGPSSSADDSGLSSSSFVPDTITPGLSSSADGSDLSSSADGSDLSSSADGSSDFIPSDTIDAGVNIDYTQILNAIHRTLQVANEQRDILSEWDIDFMRPVRESISNIEDYSLNSWQTELEINDNLTGMQDQGFNLAADVKFDLDSSRLLLDEINHFLRNDTLKTYSTDTTYNPLLRDIAAKLDSTGSVDSTYELLKPFFKDSGQYDSPITRFLESFSSNFERSNEDMDFCSSYYSCLSGGGRDCLSRFPGAQSRCVQGGSPLDGVLNIEMGILETLWDAIFGPDSTPIPRDDDSDSVDVLPPGFSSASAELKRANDSLASFNLGITLDSMRSLLETAKNMNKDTTKIQPDSLWLDSTEAKRYVEHILLPSGTGTDCFVCHADLGTFGGLTDTSLKVHIDFSNFGGYNWCEIIRAVVRIATLVVCISLTLGSWAAAFGYNPKNDA